MSSDRDINPGNVIRIRQDATAVDLILAVHRRLRGDEARERWNQATAGRDFTAIKAAAEDMGFTLLPSAPEPRLFTCDGCGDRLPGHGLTAHDDGRLLCAECHP